MDAVTKRPTTCGYCVSRDRSSHLSSPLKKDHVVGTSYEAVAIIMQNSSDIRHDQGDGTYAIGKQNGFHWVIREKPPKWRTSGVMLVFPPKFRC